ncbi:MAG TPA: hypothetical protein VMM57_01605 [Bacteroidota bacterium]|nr:hypothetical protein [Bacteroidota bacterium]
MLTAGIVQDSHGQVRSSAVQQVVFGVSISHRLVINPLSNARAIPLAGSGAVEGVRASLELQGSPSQSTKVTADLDRGTSQRMTVETRTSMQTVTVQQLVARGESITLSPGGDASSARTIDVDYDFPRSTLGQETPKIIYTVTE